MIEELAYNTTSGTDVLDITHDVQNILFKQNAKNGACVVFCPSSTASVSTMEYEHGAIRDLKTALEKIAPRFRRYHHERGHKNGNGHSHLRAALMKPGITIPVVNGKLFLGQWQNIILLDFDNRPRHRRVVVQFLPA